MSIKLSQLTQGIKFLISPSPGFRQCTGLPVSSRWRRGRTPLCSNCFNYLISFSAISWSKEKTVLKYNVHLLNQSGTFSVIFFIPLLSCISALRLNCSRSHFYLNIFSSSVFIFCPQSSLASLLSSRSSSWMVNEGQGLYWSFTSLLTELGLIKSGGASPTARLKLRVR